MKRAAVGVVPLRGGLGSGGRIVVGCVWRRRQPLVFWSATWGVALDVFLGGPSRLGGHHVWTRRPRFREKSRATPHAARRNPPPLHPPPATAISAKPCLIVKALAPGASMNAGGVRRGRSGMFAH